MNSCRSNLQSWPDCKECYEYTYDVYVQNALDAPKPWIGMYIAAASAVCGMATLLDVSNGFKTKKFWFPCKYFTLNATSLTLLGIAMKLTMDLTSTKLGASDTTAGFSSAVMMSGAMGNFMTSLASMNDNEIMLNLVALGILVITVVINMWLFNVQLNKAYGISELYFDDFVGGFLLLLLIMLCTSAIIAPTIKRYVETKFRVLHKMVLSERVQSAKFTARELTTTLKKYWVMAGTGNPQFVMARSGICVIPGFVCLSMTITFLVIMGEEDELFQSSDSVYNWSVRWILIIQSVGVILGTIAPTSRLFLLARFRCSSASLRSFKDELKTETYWTQRLINWRESPMPLHIRYFKFKKFLHISKGVLLNICITIQIVIVVISKLSLIISSWFINVTSIFIHKVNEVIMYVFKITCNGKEHDSRAAGTHEFDYSPYALLLEGELMLPNEIIANISNEADKLIQVGKMRKPKKIIELLQKSENFIGVRDFDKKDIASLHVQEPLNCWSLSVVTLTSIAAAFPHSRSAVTKLVNWVNEGLPFVKFIESKINTGEELTSIRKVADIIWERLELDHKWKDRDYVPKSEMNGQTYKDTLLELSTKAKKTIMDFKTRTRDSVMDNPLCWPPEVIAANSMYRVCGSLLLIENDSTNAQFFKQISIIISDILAACLTNLAHVIFRECYINPIEKRQESIRYALILLGESEEIIQYLEHREWPNLEPDKAGYIEEWQAILELNNGNPVNSVSTNEDSSAHQSSSGQVVIKVDSSD